MTEVVARWHYENHWLPGLNFNVEAWDTDELHYETLAISRIGPRRVRGCGRQPVVAAGLKAEGAATRAFG